eukprot:1194848-Prorocentrum_minimum.AAC.4
MLEWVSRYIVRIVSRYIVCSEGRKGEMGRDAIRTRTWKGTRCCMRRVHRPVKAGMVWCVTECYIPWLATGKP